MRVVVAGAGAALYSLLQYSLPLLALARPRILPLESAAISIAATAESGNHATSSRQVFAVCLDSTSALPSARGIYHEVVSWTLRGRSIVELPSSVYLQVWRPVRMGWTKGYLGNTYLLVGENELDLTSKQLSKDSMSEPVVTLNVSDQDRIVAKAGDRLGLSVWSALSAPAAPDMAEAEDRATQEGCDDASAACRWHCFSSHWRDCGNWPTRRACSFRSTAASLSLQFEVALALALSQTSKLKLGLHPKPSTQLHVEDEPMTLVSICIELPWTLGGPTFVMWLAEYIGALRFEGAAEIPPISAWTFFVCPDGGNETALQFSPITAQWRKVVQIFGVGVGLSLHCWLESETGGMAAEFLRQLDLYGPWPVLVPDNDAWTVPADEIISASPYRFAVPFRSVLGGGPQDCITILSKHLTWANGRACLIPFPADGKDIIATRGIQQILDQSEEDHGAWAVLVFTDVRLLEVGEPNFDDAAGSILRRLLGQVGEIVGVSGTFRSIPEVARLGALLSDLNIRTQVNQATAYEELMTLRQQLPSSGLQVFEDKFRLRRELLNGIDVAHTPVYHMSNSDPDVLSHIDNLQSYVVKPTHMTESEHVFVIHNGRYHVDVYADKAVLAKAGDVVDTLLIQRKITEAWNKTAYEWECKAVVGARPGVIIERLVLATLDPGAPSHGRIEEARCHVVWGRTLAVEWSINRIGSTVMQVVQDRLGRWSLGTESIWSEVGVAGTWGADYLRDPDGWATAVVGKCISKVMFEAQRVASGARVDNLRVDFLVEGDCERIFVSEVELFPAVPFTPSVMWTIEDRWKHGYGVGVT